MSNNVSANAACVSAEALLRRQANMLASHLALISASEIVISLADSKAFAELSGDFNPVHVDPIAAGRRYYGTCITASQIETIPVPPTRRSLAALRM